MSQNSISPGDAIRLAELHFPQGPEVIAKAMGASLEYAPLPTRLGWCVRLGNRIRIRINSSQAKGRQRFTLAHELSHVLLGTEPDTLSLSRSLFSASSAIERKVDELAAQLLLPHDRVKQLVGPLPVFPETLERVAKTAGVTPTMAATRVVALSEELHLTRSAVVRLTGESVEWFFSRSLRLSNPKLVVAIRDRIRSAPSKIFRHTQKDGDILTAFQIGDPSYPTLFVQVLPLSLGNQCSPEERKRELRAQLFAGNPSWQNSFGACVGQFREQFVSFHGGADLVDTFLEKYALKPWCQVLRSEKGREYIQMYLMD